MIQLPIVFRFEYEALQRQLERALADRDYWYNRCDTAQRECNSLDLKNATLRAKLQERRTHPRVADWPDHMRDDRRIT